MIGKINTGFLLLLGVEDTDNDEDVHYLIKKAVGLRIFPNEKNNMNLALQDIGGSALVVSQFTLFADTRKGRRPSFVHAAPPEMAKEFYLKFCTGLEEKGIAVQRGRFGAMMQVQLCNEGPVTILLDSKNS